MSTPEDRHAPPGPDPEQLLRSRLRKTTSEFEARFDALRRRLAHEPQPGKWRLSPIWLGHRARRGVFAMAAAAVLALALILIRHEAGPPPGNEKEYSELVILDDTLRDAVPLIDDETIETLLLMPSDHKS